jgi:glycosyltransferase involved in cell wall biosynthesis
MSDFLERLVRQAADLKPASLSADSEVPREDFFRGSPKSKPELNNVMAAQLTRDDERRAWCLQLLSRSALFETAFYLATYPEIAERGIDPLEHFWDFGVQEDRRPNPFFEPLWYLTQYPDVGKEGLQPLLHYALKGDREGRWPGPLFNTPWYRQTYDIDPNETALAHYLAHRTGGSVAPMPEFDVNYYLRCNPDVADAQVDPFVHFIGHGWLEGRNPSEDFDVRFYHQRYLKSDPQKHPFFDWLSRRHEANVFGRMPAHEASIPREVKRFTQPAPDFEDARPLSSLALRRAKVLAFYLPQFHAFPENEAWWGKGFTEWTNVPRGLPRFAGHYQPRIPRDLGFYGLDGSTDTLRRQIELATAGGIYGFVFYYYWFNGKRLMEKPVERFLADSSLGMPFCLMWANENWTRRWDGAASEVLISQDYRASDDAKMVAEFARYMQDPRYIRVQGRPLLMLYRPGVIPDCKQTVARWRKAFRAEHQEDPVILMAQAFGDTDPKLFDLDGAFEFPPHKLTQNMLPANNEIEVLDPDFTAKVYHYDAVVEKSISEPEPDYPLLKTAIPSWDNDARRQGAGLVISGSTPGKYEAWLSKLVARAQRHRLLDEPFVCINAWNEWCEGAYLEPDLHFGCAYLNATARAVSGTSRCTTIFKLLLVGHDAFPGGAQMLLLNIGRTLRRSFGIEIAFLLLSGGELEAAYKEIAPLSIATSDTAAALKLTDFKEQGFAHAIINTIAAATITTAARAAGMEPVVLVHELPRIIREKHLDAGVAAAISGAGHLVFASPFVRDELLRSAVSQIDERAIILPQGIYQDVEPQPTAAHALRREFGILEEDTLVLGAGYGDLRKGFDLFLQLWRQLQSIPSGSRIHLLWAGGVDPGLQEWLAAEIADASTTGTFHMAGFRSDMAVVLTAADAFALTSREDPFPSVALEALSTGMPAFAFDRSGGMPDLLRELQGRGVVPYGDVVAMAGAIIATFDENRTASAAKREAQRIRLTSRFAFRPYVRALLQLAIPDLPSVSVVVPNYNYAHCMPERLASVFQQSHPVSEVIVLDDCSTDDSLRIIPDIAAAWGRDVLLVPNQLNSGSVFGQWRKAAELATSEFVWIAEADDSSERDFLARALAMMAGDQSVQFAFTDSRTINVDGSPQWGTYKPYYATVEADALAKSDIFDGSAFARKFLSVKNLILNVSSVVWRRDTLLRCLDACKDELTDLRMAGDWRLYLEALSLPGARIAYDAEPLNIHRRHAKSVTHELAAERHIEEIARCHNVARASLDLPDRTHEAQDDYLAEIRAKLRAVEAQPPQASKAPPAGRRRMPVKKKPRDVHPKRPSDPANAGDKPLQF